MRCASWRLLKCPIHPLATLPVSCRKCFRPCFAKIPQGRVRCEECEKQIALLGSQEIKLALIEENTASYMTLEYLASDPDPMVADAARAQM